MFANESFIAATRAFVCVRIETYENKDSERRVRDLLGGRLANTSFCIFASDGETRLSRAGRSPSSLLRRRSRDGGPDALIRELERIAARHETPDEASDAVENESGPQDAAAEPPLLPDALSFRQMLNVASADQRLLVLVTTDDDVTLRHLREALAGDASIGRFHVDRIDTATDAGWEQSVDGEESAAGILILRADPFGQNGEVMKQLREKASVEAIQTALLACNEEFAASEARKVYGEHVATGLRKGIEFETEIPHGEDRDADGTRDRGRRRRR